MNNKNINWRTRLGALCIGATLGLAGVTSNAHADDSEVFFGQLNPALKIFPNLLFVLDTSGSMNWTDPDPNGGTQTTRITRMKAAMNEILDAATNVNIGLMRFNGSAGGGAVLYPVTYIDEPICESTNCGSVNLVSRISLAENDGKEYSNEQVSLNGQALKLPTDGSNEELSALRFESLNIPSGATITSAVIEFTAYNNSSGSANVRIFGEKEGNSEPFTTASKSLSERADTVNKILWAPTNWSTNEIHETPNLSSIVQEVVDHDDWCGGNALSLFMDGDSGQRNAVTFERDPNQAALLKISYDSSTIGPDEGCIQKTIVAQVGTGNDDAEQRLNNNKMNRSSSDLELPKDGSRLQLVGMLFKDLDIPADSQITKAHLEFEIDEYKTGDVSLRIWGEDKHNPNSYSNNKYDISDRDKTGNYQDWINPPVLSIGERMQSPQIPHIVQEIVDLGSWSGGDDMAFIIGHLSGSGKRTVESYNGKPTAAPRLYVSYQVNVGGGEATYITARNEMKNLVNNLTATGGTPIVDALYEATQYYRGGEVDYGKRRGIYNHYTARYHRVSVPASYTGGSVYRSSGCTDANLDSSNCQSEQIQSSGGAGTATYISPIESSCQTNQIVLLSDGEPTSNSSVSKVRDLLRSTDPSANLPGCEDYGSRECGIELAEWLREQDHSARVGKQTIATYTIGLNLNSSFLDSLAQAGGTGLSKKASSSEDLVSIFNDILGEVLSVDTSFVAPGATVNQFNRLTHRNDIYFSLFKPQERPEWHGNLKKYQLQLSNDGIVRVFDNTPDSEGGPRLAVDQESGFFSEDTRSFWSDAPDGNTVAAGGAANELSLGTSGDPRKVYTYPLDTAPNHANLNNSTFFMHENNAGLITKGQMGIITESDDYHEELLKWARGVDVLDSDSDSSNTDIRPHMGDPMHARPLIINYASGGSDPDSTIYISTNEGFVHALRHTDGSEIFSFIPKDLWPNLNTLKNNSSSDAHVYGLDGSMSSWIDDLNENTVVDGNEDAYLYLGMRRGGKNYYALQVSDRDNPRFAWQIKGGQPGFELMGESWSKMIPTKVKIDGTERNVLVFGGGYDTNQDSDPSGAVTSRTADTYGRAIYMVDAKTGEKVWTGSGYGANTGSGKYTSFPDMKYSIPSDIRVVDINFDGFADQMYVGDMGGQVWRFDIDHTGDNADLVQGGVMAELASDGDPTKARRFFYEPDVALLSSEGKRYLAISIGSGWRAHPLDELIEDSFFMIRTDAVYEAPSGYGKVVNAAVLPHTYAKVTESDLLDVTNDITSEVDWTSQSGWRLGMKEPGEKVLSDSITVNNQVVFTSYVPQQSTVACTTAVGGGRVYVVDVATGRPKLDLNESGNKVDLTADDRSKELAHGGIPPEPAALFTEEGKPIILVGPEQPLDDADIRDEPVRTYWREEDPSSIHQATTEDLQ